MYFHLKRGVKMNFFETLFPVLETKFNVEKDASAHWDHSVIAKASVLRDLITFLKNDESSKMEMLLDIVGIDYLGFQDYEGPRFAVEYVLKSISRPGNRVRVKVFVSEQDLEVPTISDLYPIANWQEREVYDQYGIIFTGHPDLRRILNHVEFEGHPLRKDYPAHRRQWLSTNDFLLPALEKRLESKGYKVVQHSKEVLPNEDEYLTGSIQE